MHMIGALVGVAGIFCILMLSELLWRSRQVTSPEVARKLVHILSGVYIAFWPFFMDFVWIQILSVGLFVVVYTSKKLTIFKSIHQVQRQTHGELLFATGIFISATFSNSEWVYLAAVLHLSLADGLAAMIGVQHLRRFSYKVFGHTKTVIGSAAFYVVSLLITAGVLLLDPVSQGIAGVKVLILLPLLATFVENIALYGTDNLLVPMLVIAVLNAFQTLP